MNKAILKTAFLLRNNITFFNGKNNLENGGYSLGRNPGSYGCQDVHRWYAQQSKVLPILIIL
jgi:hypothetical protein